MIIVKFFKKKVVIQVFILIKTSFLINKSDERSNIEHVEKLKAV